MHCFLPQICPQNSWTCCLNKRTLENTSVTWTVMVLQSDPTILTLKPVDFPTDLSPYGACMWLHSLSVLKSNHTQSSHTTCTSNINQGLTLLVSCSLVKCSSSHKTGRAELRGAAQRRLRPRSGTEHKATPLSHVNCGGLALWSSCFDSHSSCVPSKAFTLLDTSAFLGFKWSTGTLYTSHANWGSSS